MNLTIEDLLSIDYTTVTRLNELQKTRLKGVSTDSRAIKQGEIFVALRGKKFDGHNFIHTAQQRGACCIIVDEQFDFSKIAIPCFVVKDTVRALGQLAHRYRKKFKIPIVAITGSSGKTTTKEMITAILKKKYNVLSSEGTKNNHIGVPMTLFRLRTSHDIAVVEMGMNHYGEIHYLCSIAEPTHGLITNIGKAHIEFFGTVENIGKAKGELFEWLGMKNKQIGFVNADDALVMKQSKPLQRKILYGFASKRAQVRGKIIGTDSKGQTTFSITTAKCKQPMVIQLYLPGIHNMHNALAAAAVGLHFKVPVRDIISALEKLRPMKSRMQTVRISNVTIVNDTYNANPDSVAASLQSLATIKSKGKKIIVLGDMLELGKSSLIEHRAVGRLISRLKFSRVLTYGTYSREISSTVRNIAAKHYNSKAALVKDLVKIIQPGDVILVKGSRGMMMEEVVDNLKKKLKKSAA